MQRQPPTELQQVAEPAKSDSPTAAALRRWGPLLVVIAAVYAYANATKGPFIFDDFVAILENQSVRSLWPLWETMFPPGHVGSAGRPLVALSFALNCAFDGLNPRYYHAVNIALHALCGLTMLGIVRRVLRRINWPAAEPLALIATLVWTVHPIHTDAVTYIMSRTEVMMALFALLAIYSFLRSVDSSNRRGWLVTSVICALASVGSKEVGAMIAPVIVIIDVLLVSGGWKQAWRRHRWYYGGLLLTWIALPLLLATASGTVKSGGGRLSSWQYLLMQTQVVPMYLKLTFWPSPLVLDYVDWPVPAGLGDVLPYAIGLTMLLAVSVWLVVKKHPAGVIGAMFFLVLAPSSSILPLGSEPAAERRVYLPLVAVIPGVVLAIDWLRRRFEVPARAGVIAAAVLVLGLGQLTLWRNEDYSSAAAIWTDTAEKRPNNPRAQTEVASILQDEGDVDGALRCLERAIAVAPFYVEPRINRALIWTAQGRHADALAEMDFILREQPLATDAVICKAWILSRAGRRDEGIALLEGLLRENPNDLKARSMLEEIMESAVR